MLQPGDQIGPFCFHWSDFLKNTEVLQTLGLLYSTVKKYVSILTKNGMGNILGDFFIKLIWSHWLHLG
jgi:hypothetical protein